MAVHILKNKSTQTETDTGKVYDHVRSAGPLVKGFSSHLFKI